jgi:hypothetical protein
VDSLAIAKHGGIIISQFEIPVPVLLDGIDLEFVSIQQPPKGGLVNFTVETATQSEDLPKDVICSDTPGRGVRRILSVGNL